MDPDTCKHAPPSKRVVLRSQFYPTVSMVQDLVKQYDPEGALMLAERMEELGFPGWAQKLRRKSFPTNDMVRVVDEIASAMGLTTPHLYRDCKNWKTAHKRKKPHAGEAAKHAGEAAS